MKKSNNKINWTQFILSLLVTILFTFSVGLFSYFNDLKNTKINQEALRPWIAVEPIKFDDTNSYIYINDTEKGFNSKVRLKITNNGQSIATNITTSDVYATIKETFTTSKITFVSNSKAKITPEGTMSLTPTESTFIDIEFESPVIDKRNLIDLKEKVKNNTYELPFAIEIYYSGGENILTNMQDILFVI